jgi:hypothetical protein
MLLLLAVLLANVPILASSRVAVIHWYSCRRKRSRSYRRERREERLTRSRYARAVKGTATASTVDIFDQIVGLAFSLRSLFFFFFNTLPLAAATSPGTFVNWLLTCRVKKRWRSGSCGTGLDDPAAVDVLVGRIERLLSTVQWQDLKRDSVGLHHHESLADWEIAQLEVLAWAMQVLHLYSYE